MYMVIGEYFLKKANFLLDNELWKFYYRRVGIVCIRGANVGCLLARELQNAKAR